MAEITPSETLKFRVNQTEGPHKVITLKPNECEGDPPIVIDLSSKIPADREIWRITNTGYIRLPEPLNPRLVHLNPQDLKNDYLNGVFDYVQWLKDNQGIIDYSGSADAIRCGHTITDPDIIYDIENSPTIDELSLADLKNLINKNGNYFDVINYDYHVSFFINDDDELDTEVMVFVKDLNCYSFPLLRAVTKSTPDATYVFKQLTEDVSGKKFIVFIIRDENTSTLVYYDVSHIPPMLPRRA